MFERLSILHNNEKVKADFFLSTAWDSYWHRMELSNWLKRIRRGWKKLEGLLPNPSTVSLATSIYISAVNCLVSYLIWYCLVFSCLVLHSPILCLNPFEPPFLTSTRNCSWLWEFGTKSAFAFILLGFWDRISWLHWWAAASLLCGSFKGYCIAVWNSHTVRECCCELLWLEKSVQEGLCLFACGVRSKRLIWNVLSRSVVKCSSFRFKG